MLPLQWECHTKLTQRDYKFMMNKEKKKIYIDEMKKAFSSNEAVMVAHYQGLNVNQLDKLRKELREKGILFKITKNRITKIAINGSISFLCIRLSKTDVALTEPFKSI